ncbi:hypothetical protein A3D60_02730 [Candidatus Uhrbacteria bacterium RIFCSPHIGHO2_02_FULL_47_29]|nr:MAG: hypothetical protein A3D60_02730 [Candidatus Uhrbacteria bacterium RIFCSPHIGHO2_02_FULL_47_29]
MNRQSAGKLGEKKGAGMHSVNEFGQLLCLVCFAVLLAATVAWLATGERVLSDWMAYGGGILGFIGLFLWRVLVIEKKSSP